MSTTQTPPIGHPLIDKDLNATEQWALWFISQFNGDKGTPWVPQFTGLTEVGGAATITGRIFNISQSLLEFYVTITPVTNTSSTAGTTSIDNPKLPIGRTGSVFAMVDKLGSNAGVCHVADNKIYVPGWTTITTPVYLWGRYGL